MILIYIILFLFTVNVFADSTTKEIMDTTEEQELERNVKFLLFKRKKDAIGGRYEDYEMVEVFLDKNIKLLFEISMVASQFNDNDIGAIVPKFVVKIVSGDKKFAESEITIGMEMVNDNCLKELQRIYIEENVKK